MKNQKILKKGFTLIELLVVVALIALLATVVIISLNVAKNKGSDAGVKENLHSITNQAELFFINNNNSYLPVGGSTFAIATCPAKDTVSGTNMMSKDGVVADAISKAVLTGSGSSCYNSAAAWAVAVGLKSDVNASWCVDSTGNSKQEAVAVDSAIVGTACN